MSTSSAFIYDKQKQGLGRSIETSFRRAPQSGGSTGSSSPSGRTQKSHKQRKKDLQKKLKDMGYPMFSSMSGFGGDEQAKAEAMQVIYDAISTDPDSAGQIVSWLEWGKITPKTIIKINSRKRSSGTIPAKRRDRSSVSGGGTGSLQNDQGGSTNGNGSTQQDNGGNAPEEEFNFSEYYQENKTLVLGAGAGIGTLLLFALLK